MMIPDSRMPVATTIRVRPIDQPRAPRPGPRSSKGRSAEAASTARPFPPGAASVRTATNGPIRVVAPATCGELGQGYLDGQDFLINCPIDLFASAAVDPGDDRGLRVSGPGSVTKVVAAIESMAARFGIATDHRVTVDSPIPRGKGMASSTADISAALTAVAHHHGIDLTEAAFGRLITSIEPSDCIHVAGIGEVDHLTGRLINRWTAPAAIRVLVVDCGGAVDTMGFDRERARAIYREARGDVLHFRALLRYGLTLGNAEAIGRGATLSARLSQRILPKPPLEDLLASAIGHGAWGVNCAHSGTVLGVLHPDSDRITDALVDTIERRFGSDAPVLGRHRIIAGGCQHAN